MYVNPRSATRMIVPFALALLTIGACKVLHGQPRSITSEAAASAEDAGRNKAQLSAVPELQEMISAALKNHPEVSAAQAQLLQSQANLDRVRLEVAQRVVEYQKTLRTLELSLKTEQAKLREHQAVNNRAPNSIPEPQLKVQEAKIEAIRVKLAGVNSQLPFILGQTFMRSEPRVEFNGERELAEQLVAHAQSGYDSAVALFRSGKIMQHFVEHWSKRLMEAEELLQGESAQAAERHRDRMQSLLDSVKQQFEVGVASRMDFASAQYSVIEANRLLKRRQ